MVKTLKVKSITKETSIEDKLRYLDVTFELIGEDDEVLETRRLGFPIDASEKYILKELKTYLKIHNQDLQRASDNADLEASEKKADKAIKGLTGAEI